MREQDRHRSEPGHETSAATIPVWDLPLRLFHWTLAVVVLTGIAAIYLDNVDLHVRCGQGVLALVLFRIIWGFVGPEYARFSSFVRGPAAIASYARALRRRPHEFHAGHNPLGGVAIMLMLALLLMQAVSGLFANDDIVTEGPLARLVSKSASDAITAFHDANAWLIIGLIVVHIVAILVHLIRFRDNLIQPMITGAKRVPAGARVTGISGDRSALALVVIGFSALSAWLAFELPDWIAPLAF